MAKKKEVKTNAVRILERMGISYKMYHYECEEFIDGMHVVALLGLPPEQVYKTLVTVSTDKEHFVFVIPVAEELDLKKAAKAVGQKSLAMIPVSEITAVTGYVRGGCTAVGMKKQFVTKLDESIDQYEHIYVSGGKIGVQIELRPKDLKLASDAECADLCKK